MEDVKLTDEERAHITARRELAAAEQKKKLEAEKAVDTDEIKPGMTRGQVQRVLGAIRNAWLGGN